MPAEVFASLIVMRFCKLDYLLGHRLGFISSSQSYQYLGQSNHRAYNQMLITASFLQSQTLFKCLTCCLVFTSKEMSPTNSFERKRNLARVTQVSRYAPSFVDPCACF